MASTNVAALNRRLLWPAYFCVVLAAFASLGKERHDASPPCALLYRMDTLFGWYYAACSFVVVAGLRVAAHMRPAHTGSARLLVDTFLVGLSTMYALVNVLQLERTHACNDHRFVVASLLVNTPLPLAVVFTIVGGAVYGVIQWRRQHRTPTQHSEVPIEVFTMGDEE